jgi:hypothetical protein
LSKCPQLISIYNGVAVLNDKDRTHLENQIISGLFLAENFFLKIYDFNPNHADLFQNIYNREIYSEATEHYIEKGYPTAPNVFNQLILKHASEHVKNHFLSGPAKAEPILDFNAVLRLIEDSIERKARKLIEDTEKRKIIGLEYAETIREEIDKVLL